MRDIKFRAWADGYMHEDITTVTNASYNGIAPHEGTILMQYTGLKDKNGTEIFEGDIVRRKSSNSTIELVAVEYQAPRFNIGDFVTEYGYEIIGNVWENPELLK